MNKALPRCLLLWLGISLISAMAASQPSISSNEGSLSASDGARLYYRIIGSGPRTVLIPVAYWNMAAFENYGDHLRFIFYDPPNRGRSERLDLSHISFERDLDDLETVRSHFGLEQISLIGSSYYGGLAAIYAARNPRKVEKLVMVGPISPRAKLLYAYDPPAKKGLVDPKELDRLALLNESEKDRARYCREHWKVHGIKYVGNPAAAHHLGGLCDLPNEWPEHISPWAAALLEGMGDWNWRGEAETIQAPTLIVHGKKDLIVPLEGSQEWHQALSNSQLVILEKAGHADWFGAAGELFPLVMEFLEKPPKETSVRPSAPEHR